MGYPPRVPQSPLLTTREAVAAFIRRRDRAFGSVIDAVGPPPLRRAAPVARRFEALVESVVSQLLSIKAADTIFERVRGTCGGTVSVDSVLSVSHEELRACGLSNAKAATILDLAARVASGSLALGAHSKMDDHAVEAALCEVKGIGRWTAQMYLLFTLARRDVWPVGDLGVRRGWSILHGMDEDPTPAALGAHGEPFRGVRSALAWYCWQAVHLSRN